VGAPLRNGWEQVIRPRKGPGEIKLAAGAKSTTDPNPKLIRL
jgi:hypothetical protein